MLKAVDGGGSGTGGLGPGEIEAIGEEFGALGGGDKDGAARGLRFELGDGGEKGVDDGGAQTVVIVTGESEIEEVAPLL